MSRTFSPDHALFVEWDNPLQYKEIRLSLGCANGLEREAEGVGAVCVATPVKENGTLAGTAGHPGFVVRFPVSDLIDAGFDRDQIYLAQGANEATRIDSDGPICDDCLAAAGELKASKRLPKAPAGKPCWSCSQMIEESWAEAELASSAR